MRHPSLVLLVTLAACAPRQAIVETDPRGGDEARARLEGLARGDLDRLRRAQGTRFADEGSYTYELEALGFEPSAGIEVSVLEASSTGFSALAVGGSVECGIFVGDASPPRAYVLTAGVVACRGR